MSAEALTQSAQELIALAGDQRWDIHRDIRPKLRASGLRILSLVETIKAAGHDIDCPGRIGLNNCTCFKATAFADAMKGE